MTRIIAHYLIETADDPERAAAIMAGEQSLGTFVKLTAETPERVAKYGARVERVEVVEEVAEPSLPGAREPQTSTDKPYQRAEVTVSFPLDTIGDSLVGLWTAVAGNLFELAPFSGLKLTGLELPASFTDAHPGPQFGIPGTRELADVQTRPLVGTIIKPSVGLSPAETAELVSTLCTAGLDFIKDDELQSHSPHSPFEDRVQAVMDIVNRYADAVGKKVMVAFNLSGDIDAMRHRHDVVLECGGTCVMVNMLAVGLAGVQALRKHSQLPIHGHRAGWGMLDRHPRLGMSYPAFSTFFRLAGADHLHVNGLRNKFCESDASVIRSACTCLMPIHSSQPVMPVFSSGQWAGQAPDTYQALGSSDLIYLAGGGIMGHPDGPAAGVRSLVEAWEATLEHIPLETYATSHPALAAALSKFGTTQQ
ncbi:MAG: ribulose-bisphosphate carboxylase large subunit family protein [Deinococcota bacterium]